MQKIMIRKNPLDLAIFVSDIPQASLIPEKELSFLVEPLVQKVTLHMQKKNKKICN